MAKQKSTKASKKEVESLVQVTPANRKFCIKLGRKLYVYNGSGQSFKIAGDFIVRPRLVKGWMQFGDHRFYVSQDEDRDSYVESFREVIDHFIKEGKLYMNADEQLIKFE